MMTYQELGALEDEKGNIPNFFELIKKDLGIENNPKADKMLSIAWEEGHANGYYEVYLHAMDLVELIR
jgi:hypothetical protein